MRHLKLVRTLGLAFLGVRHLLALVNRLILRHEADRVVLGGVRAALRGSSQRFLLEFPEHHLVVLLLKADKLSALISVPTIPLYLVGRPVHLLARNSVLVDHLGECRVVVHKQKVARLALWLLLLRRVRLLRVASCTMVGAVALKVKVTLQALALVMVARLLHELLLLPPTEAQLFEQCSSC